MPSAPALPGPSISAAFGRLPPAQYRIVARILGGEDVRYYSHGIHHTTALALMRKGIVDCQAATCRLVLTPANHRSP